MVMRAGECSHHAGELPAAGTCGGPAHAGKTVEITVEADTYQITVGRHHFTAPRTTSRDIKRHKASNYDHHLGAIGTAGWALPAAG